MLSLPLLLVRLLIHSLLTHHLTIRLHSQLTRLRRLIRLLSLDLSLKLCRLTLLVLPILHLQLRSLIRLQLL